MLFLLSLRLFCKILTNLLELKSTRNNFTNESTHTKFTFKTSNLYKMDISNYRKLLFESISSAYKKAALDTRNIISNEAKLLICKNVRGKNWKTDENITKNLLFCLLNLHLIVQKLVIPMWKLSMFVLDKTLNCIRGVWLDNRKVFSYTRSLDQTFWALFFVVQ